MDKQEKRESFSPPAIGGSSLLTVFAVLALTVFALLSLSTVRADVRLADSAAQAVTGYYAADCKAQEILARLRNGEEPEGVTFQTGTVEVLRTKPETPGFDPQDEPVRIAEYAVAISGTQELQVEVLLRSADYEVVRWQAAPTGEWTGGENYTVWDGEWEENSYD